MDKEQRRNSYLAMAEEAERKAEAAADPQTKEGWRKIAESYRELARHTWIVQKSSFFGWQ